MVRFLWSFEKMQKCNSTNISVSDNGRNTLYTYKDTVLLSRVIVKLQGTRKGNILLQ